MHHRRGILTNGKRPPPSHVVYVNEFVHSVVSWFVSEKEAKTRVVPPGGDLHTCREQVLGALHGPPSSPSPVYLFVSLSISFRALGSSARSPAPYLCRRASWALRPAYVCVGLCVCARAI